MDETSGADSRRTGLPLILACAVIQGWALYGLHHALTHKHWPAADVAVLLGLYAAVVFVPLTLQLLAEHAHSRVLWLTVAVLAAAFFGFGFHDGGYIYSEAAHRSPTNRLPALLFVLALLWLQLLPFVQGRLAAGHWRFGYPVLFAKAWHNKLVLAEASLFTGLFWLLLFLWQELFALLDIKFFEELFAEPIFIYPVTALTFGIALHLIGSVERLTMAILDQLLSVLKWLAGVVGFLLVIFSAALAVKLPGLLATGERAIGAQWLLWLVAVLVLLLNAAYRDGSDAQPYPAWLGRALRLAVPLSILVSLTALYALVVRTGQYGLTVERVWAFVVAGAALLHAVGYSLAALGRVHWMQGMARVNVIGSLALMAVLVLALTPALSPYRLAASSQFAAALERPTPVTDPEESRNGLRPIPYLRFAAGAYGQARLEELATLEGHPDAARIRKDATAAMAAKHQGELNLAAWPETLDALVVYPRDRAIEPALRKAMDEWAEDRDNKWEVGEWRPGDGAGVYVDLDADGSEEFALLFPSGSEVFARADGAWQDIGRLERTGRLDDWKDLLRDLGAGRIDVKAPRWHDLVIGKRRWRVFQAENHVRPSTATAAPMEPDP